MNDRKQTRDIPLFGKAGHAARAIKKLPQSRRSDSQRAASQGNGWRERPGGPLPSFNSHSQRHASPAIGAIHKPNADHLLQKEVHRDSISTRHKEVEEKSESSSSSQSDSDSDSETASTEKLPSPKVSSSSGKRSNPPLIIPRSDPFSQPVLKPVHPLASDSDSETSSDASEQRLVMSSLSSAKLSSQSSRTYSSTAVTTPDSDMDSTEFDLLDSNIVVNGLSHALVTAPIITRDAFCFGNGLSNSVPQYGVLGSIVSINEHDNIEKHEDERVYINTNAPFSAVVCGVQGAGKSHTVGVMLESMMITNDSRLGALNKPLAGLVLHFGEVGDSAQPCEAAYQCITKDPRVKPPVVRVFVSPSQESTMRKMYQKAFGGRVTVTPLKIAHDELDATSVLSMMSVSTVGEPPLYVQIILNILRDLGEKFTYTTFKKRLDVESKNFNPQQKSGFQQRFTLLEAFLQPKLKNRRFASGEITIIDLTDPFIDAASACSLFEIVTRLFLRAKVDSGKVLVVDEAHKYLTRDRGAMVLSQTLLSIVRQQRHLGIRLILSTQEPTVIPPALLDLCTITIMHRFSSISWFEHLAKHVSSEFTDSAFDKVVKLQTGQAMVLAPSGLGVFKVPGMDDVKEVTNFGRRFMVMKTRRRVTADGGASILAV